MCTCSKRAMSFFMGLGAAEVLMMHQGFHDLKTDGKHGIQRGHRFLEDHRHLTARAIFVSLFPRVAGRLAPETRSIRRRNGPPAVALAA